MKNNNTRLLLAMSNIEGQCRRQTDYFIITCLSLIISDLSRDDYYYNLRASGRLLCGLLSAVGGDSAHVASAAVCLLARIQYHTHHPIAAAVPLLPRLSSYTLCW